MGTLGERRAAILRAVVSGYIRTGDPIGSASLASRYRLGVSAATIRNDMAALEKLGFLRQPHTSSGRVPTDRGYRFYVDAIPSTQAPPSQWRRSIARYFGEPPRDPDEVIRGAALLLSRITRYGAVAQPPLSAHVVVMGTANIVGEEGFERRETVRGLREASIVAAPYGAGDRPLGAIAVLGPTRMLYRESISTVRSVAEHLGQTIERLAG